MCFFGYGFAPPFLRYHVVDAQGRLVRSLEIDVPWASMMHDFVVTRRHVIFLVFPATIRLENVERTGSPIGWEPELGGAHRRDAARRHERRRGLVRDRALLRLPSHERLGRRRPGRHRSVSLSAAPAVRGCGHAGPGGSRREAHALDPRSRGRRRQGGASRRRRGRVPAARRAARRALAIATATAPASTPPAGPRASSTRSSIGISRPGSGAITSCRRTTWWASRSSCRGTPGRRRATAICSVVVYRGEEKRSDLLVLDARNVDRAPLATVQLSHRVPFGFHGNWAPGV